MTLLHWAERHIDTTGKIWAIYDTPNLPLPAPEGCRWIHAEQEVPTFRERSEYFKILNERRELLRERRELLRERREYEKHLRLEQRREKRLNRLREAEEAYRQSKAEEARKEAKKIKLTCVLLSRAAMVAKRLESKGWSRIATGTWKPNVYTNLARIVFKSHEYDSSKFFIEAHFRKAP